MFRHLPPTAAPLRRSELFSGLLAIRQDDQPRCDFEALLSARFGTDRSLAVASGRTALRLILEALKADTRMRGRTQVILPAYTCPVLVAVTRDAGLTPVLCDITPQNLDYNETHLTRLVDGNTMAVVHVHPFGLPRPEGRLVELADAVGAVLIDDACQALGAEIDGRPVGTFGQLGFASFGPGKPLSLGGGGVIFVNDPRWHEPVRRVVDQLPATAWRASAVAWIRLVVFDQLFRPAGWWAATRLGLNRAGDDERNWGYRMQWLTAPQAVIGLRALEHLDQLNAARRQVGEALTSGLEGAPGLHLLPLPASAAPIYLRYPLLVESLAMREMIFKGLWGAGIGVGKMYQKTLPEIFPDLPAGSYPGAAHVARHLLTLPTHAFVRPADVDQMVTLIGCRRIYPAAGIPLHNV